MAVFLFRLKDGTLLSAEDLPNIEDARLVAIGLASDRLEQLSQNGRPLVVDISIDSEDGSITETLHSVGEDDG